MRLGDGLRKVKGPMSLLSDATAKEINLISAFMPSDSAPQVAAAPNGVEDNDDRDDHCVILEETDSECVAVSESNSEDDGASESVGADSEDVAVSESNSDGVAVSESNSEEDGVSESVGAHSEDDGYQ
jgi:hypothetical protein